MTPMMGAMSAPFISTRPTTPKPPPPMMGAMPAPFISTRADIPKTARSHDGSDVCPIHLDSGRHPQTARSHDGSDVCPPVHWPRAEASTQAGEAGAGGLRVCVGLERRP